MIKEILIRGYQPTDSPYLARIFERAILAIDNRIYSPERKSAWIGNRSNEFWQSRFQQTLPFVAVVGDVIGGFLEFNIKDNVGEIDCFYIDPNLHNQGVGKALFNKILSVAKENNIYQINVSASHIAKPFFEKQGFKIIRKNTLETSDVILENWSMFLRV